MEQSATVLYNTQYQWRQRLSANACSAQSLSTNVPRQSLERSLDVRPHSAVDVLFQFWDNTLECPFHSTGAVVVHPDGQPMERHALLLRMADLQQNQMVLNKKS